MGGSKGSSSTTVMKNLPTYAEGYVKSFIERAADLSNTALQSYADLTYAAQNADETDAITKLAARGRNGNQTIARGVSHVEGVLDGDYLLGTKPEFLTALDKALSKPAATFNNDIKPKIGSTILLMTSTENLAQKMVENTTSRYGGRASAMMYLKNYEAERKMQIIGLDHGIEFASQSAKDAEVLRLAGLYVREYLQGKYEDVYKKWYEDQIKAVRRLELLGNAIRALVGTQEATTAPVYRPNSMVAAAGGAMTGAGTAMAIGAAYGSPAGPIGIAAGALIGGIIGLASS